MPWTDPERWLTVPVIGIMLGFFFKGIAKKKESIDAALSGYVPATEIDSRIEHVVNHAKGSCVTVDACEMQKKNVTLELKNVIQTEITKLKDEIFQQLRSIEKAIQNGNKL